MTFQPWTPPAANARSPNLADFGFRNMRPCGCITIFASSLMVPSSHEKDRDLGRLQWDGFSKARRMTSKAMAPRQGPQAVQVRTDFRKMRDFQPAYVCSAARTLILPIGSV